ncbi:zinc ribbon domain-containing protein [Flavobacterium solisilvae]|nr:zinc ribbon domain-containing protein [Flavobacterium solisilvae]
MIFFGTRLRSIKKGMLTHVLCQYCGEDSEMEYDFQQKYFHLYFIPFFPLKKKVSVCCENCYSVFEGKYIDQAIQVKLNRVTERHPINTPIWTFSGIILLTLLISWAIWQSDRHSLVETDYIKNPKKGDVYFVEHSPKEYTTIYSTWRVDKVDNQNVYFTYNDTSVTKYTKVFSILSNNRYTTKKGILSRKKIEDLFKKDSIISITRE